MDFLAVLIRQMADPEKLGGVYIRMHYAAVVSEAPFEDSCFTENNSFASRTS